MTDATPSNANAYAALVAKVDAFHREVEKRRDGDLICRRGCDACCRVELTVSVVEAESIKSRLRTLDEATRIRLAERAAAPSVQQPRCVMLEDDGQCAVYPVRPLVCRTQGLPLRYPPRTFPEEAVMARGDEGSDIVWCPLNFKDRPPQGPDVLEAVRVDEMLALINLEHVQGDPAAAVERVAVRSLAGLPSDGEGRGG